VLSLCLNLFEERYYLPNQSLVLAISWNVVKLFSSFTLIASHTFLTKYFNDHEGLIQSTKRETHYSVCRLRKTPLQVCLNVWSCLSTFSLKWSCSVLSIAHFFVMQVLHNFYPLDNAGFAIRYMATCKAGCDATLSFHLTCRKNLLEARWRKLLLLLFIIRFQKLEGTCKDHVVWFQCSSRIKFRCWFIVYTSNNVVLWNLISC